MPIDRFLAVIAAILNFFGVLFLIVGTYRLITSDLNTRLTATLYTGFSPDHLKSLSREKSCTISGLILIAISLLIQIVPLVVIHEPLEILGGQDRIALTLAICVAVIPVIFAFRRNLRFCRRFETEAKRALMKDRLVRTLNQNQLTRAHWSTVVEAAETLLGIPRPPKNEPIEIFLRKLAHELGVNFPIGLKIKD